MFVDLSCQRVRAQPKKQHRGLTPMMWLREWSLLLGHSMCSCPPHVAADITVHVSDSSAQSWAVLFCRPARPTAAHHSYCCCMRIEIVALVLSRMARRACFKTSTLRLQLEFGTELVFEERSAIQLHKL